MLNQVVRKAIVENPERWSQCIKNPAMIGWFVGRVMILTNGQADKNDVQIVLNNYLNASRNTL